MNKEGDYISQRIDIPSQKKEKYFPSDIFMDKDIHLEDELYDQGVEEDKIDDYLDEYAEKKEDIIFKWFQQRWKNVLKENNIKSEAYFSPHDSFFHTDLSTSEQFKDDQIKEKYS